MKNTSRVLWLIAPAMACALVFGASEVWNTKDASQWSSEDINRILNDSPWAKSVNVGYEPSGAEQPRGRMGRMGGGGIGYPGGGVGYPGGGIGYPGGVGYPRGGGMGYPGGGGGYPGGGYPGGGRESMPQQTVLVRWESAKPVRQALERQGGTPAGEAASDRQNPGQEPGAELKAGEPAQQTYVIRVTGLQMLPSRNPGSNRGGYDQGGYGQDDDSARNGSNRNSQNDPERLRQRLMSSAQLIRKNQPSISASDVKLPQGDLSDIQFFFPKMDAISAGDKDVTFKVRLSGMDIERRFHLKDMMVQGRLEL